MATNLHFSESSVNDAPFQENGHSKTQCHYKKFTESVEISGRNQFRIITVYVHIRICHCHYDRENVPDRSQFIHDGHPRNGTWEKNGIEFHVNSECGWIKLGSDDQHALKRVCVCGRYQTKPEPQVYMYDLFSYLPVDTNKR